MNEFIEVCHNSISMAEAARELGIKFSTFVRKAKKLGCYNPNQNWRKNKTPLSDKRLKTKYIDELFTENSPVRREYIKKIIIKDNLIEYKCSECDLSNMWNNKLLSLHLDHINGIRNDNRIENLRFVCPNCHSQTETYCNKNKCKSKSINSFDIEFLKNCILQYNNISEIINYLGVKDTFTNRSKIKKIISDYNMPL
jgi:Zn finger protein HypA/HybF involved in hydrogenase expression